ncbi:MAG: ABC transporter permease [Verrucomicrobia bacterium]|nr:ABC transporter permease [Verrucomicrobiota bacterium]
MTLIILFTSIFSTISVIEDRRDGFLQSVLVAPVSPGAIVFGKVLGGTAVASVQGIFFLMLAPMVGIHWTAVSFGMTALVIVLVGIALTGLGFAIAWQMDSTQGFHAIMNLFLIPMWLLSGAFFPASGAPSWLGWIMRLNPLTYGVAGLRRALYWSHPMLSWDIPSLPRALGVTLIFGFLFFALSFLLVVRGKNV